MSTSFYGFTALTGGAAGALDAIDGALLADKDQAIGCVGTTGITRIYSLDADSSGTDDGVNIIAPDNNAGTKRWILQSPVAFGTANLARFMNAAGTGIEWAYTCNIISYTRANSSSGDVSYTGAGFKPRMVVAFARAAANPIGSIGISNGTTHLSIPFTEPQSYSTTRLIQGKSNGVNDYQAAVLKSLDADGCTLTWTKVAGGDVSNGVLLFFR
jgi:hypothetical protein